jgi:uncharacterized membrane protein
MSTPPSTVRHELAVYFAHVRAVIQPGRKAPNFETVNAAPARVGESADWSDEHVELLIEEGRRKLDDQAARFDRIRQTAQVILPTGTALLVVAASELSRIQAESHVGLRRALYLGWFASVAAILAGILGAAAILVVRAAFGTVLPTLLSQCPSKDIKKTLASAYTEQVTAGENTLNTRLTLQWWSVLFVIAGGVAFCVLWAVRTL